MEMEPIQPNLEIELFSHPTLNPGISAALQNLKSFSPGEVYEFLQHRFPLQSLKSKAHAKAASALLDKLNDLLDSDFLERSEKGQIRLYQKTLQLFISEFEQLQASQELQVSQPEPAPVKNKFSDTILSRLKASAEAERKRIFTGITRPAKNEDGTVEAKFRKVRK